MIMRRARMPRSKVGMYRTDIQRPCQWLPTHSFSGAAPEPGVIAGDKDPPRYEPSLRDLPPVGPSIRGCLYLSAIPRLPYALRGIHVGLLAYSQMDFYERRLRATLSAVYATRLSLNHSRTCRLSAASPFPRLRPLREDGEVQPSEKLRNCAGFSTQIREILMLIKLSHLQI